MYTKLFDDTYYLQRQKSRLFFVWKKISITRMNTVTQLSRVLRKLFNGP